MTPKNTTERYGSVAIALHWLMVLLLIAVYACINLTDLFDKGSAPRETLKALHFMLGLSVLVFVLLRLANRLAGTAPAPLANMPTWQVRLASLMHLALYGLMLAMPLLGWMILSAAGKPIPFFGFELPALVAQNKDFADTLKELHEAIGTAGYFLIGAHAAAGLFHHYVSRDATLLRMLPARR